MTDLSIYTAGPLFNEKEIRHCEIIETMCENNNFKYFSPRLNTTDDNKDLAYYSKLLFSNTWETEGLTKQDVLKGRDKAATGIFKLNEKGIDDANIIIACIDNRDPGTMFEIGYAIAKNKPVITYSFENYGCNIMISQSAVYHANITEDDTIKLSDAVKLAYTKYKEGKTLQEIRKEMYEIDERELI